MPQPIEVDVAVAVPVAYTGLRRVLSCLAEIAPVSVARTREREPEVWARLFPSSALEGRDLSDLALSPSERRLHRESEQVFRILNVSARLILDALEESGRTLQIRNAGAGDLPTLRGLMRAVEWGRLETDQPRIAFSGWGALSPLASTGFAERRRRFIASLAHRTRSELDGGGKLSGLSAPAPVDPESRYIAETLEPKNRVERRLAAAVLAIRNCFFSTNYEGTWLVAETLLDLLRQHGQPDVAAVRAEWSQLDDGKASAAVEIDEASLGDADELRALVLRSVGVVRSFCGENDAAMECFGEALDCKISPERRGQLRMFRALSLIKRMGQLKQAREEAQQGIDGMSASASDEAKLHEAWLRNVMALTYFQEKNFAAVEREEMRAIHCVGGLHTPSATHLKINLITNLSVMHESTGEVEKAIVLWRKFEKTLPQWDVNFFKHHRYRLASLVRLSRGDAEPWYREAYESAKKLDDAFHMQVIASDLGYVALDRGDRDGARQWFEKATGHARAFGDPMRIAENLAGQLLAGGEVAAEAIVRHARLSTTFEKEASRLIEAAEKGDRAALLAALPRPKNKLNRPFDLVNLY